MNVFQLILDGKCVKRPIFILAGANCTTFLKCQVGFKSWPLENRGIISERSTI